MIINYRALSFSSIVGEATNTRINFCRITPDYQLYLTDLFHVYLGSRECAKSRLSQVLTTRNGGMAGLTTVIRPIGAKRCVRVATPANAMKFIDEYALLIGEEEEFHAKFQDVIRRFADGDMRNVTMTRTLQDAYYYFSDEEGVNDDGDAATTENDEEEEQEADDFVEEPKDREDFPIIQLNGRNVMTTHDYYLFASQLVSAVIGCAPGDAGQKLKRIDKTQFDPALLTSREGLSSRQNTKTLVVSRFNAATLIQALVGKGSAVADRLCQDLRAQIILARPRYSVKNPPPSISGTVPLVGFSAPVLMMTKKTTTMSQDAQDPDDDLSDSMPLPRRIPRTPSPEPGRKAPMAPRKKRRTARKASPGQEKEKEDSEGEEVKQLSTRGDDAGGGPNSLSSLQVVRNVVDVLTEIQAIPGLTGEERAVLRSSAMRALPGRE